MTVYLGLNKAWSEYRNMGLIGQVRFFPKMCQKVVFVPFLSMSCDVRFYIVLCIVTLSPPPVYFLAAIIFTRESWKLTQAEICMWQFSFLGWGYAQM